MALFLFILAYFSDLLVILINYVLINDNLVNKRLYILNIESVYYVNSADCYIKYVDRDCGVND